MSELKNKPKDTAFKQQRIPSFQPNYTPKVIFIIFFTLASVFYIFGFPIYALSKDIKEVTKRYDNCKKDSKGECTIYLDIDEEIPEPVFIYYKLTNFYQNHRLFVRSKSYTQLRNGDPLESELDLCKPAKYNKDFKGYYDQSKKNLDGDDVAYPCGMIARSVFNDTFKIDDYTITDDDIVYDVDKEIFKNSDDKEKQWMNIDNRFRSWMKISPFSTFRKLWGIIEKDVKKGKVKVTIEDNFPVHKWDGKKYLVLSNANAFGGKSPALGIILISAGSFCILGGMVFLTTWLLYKPKVEGDPLSWKY
jgi:hypothetical protein